MPAQNDSALGQVGFPSPANGFPNLDIRLAKCGLGYEPSEGSPPSDGTSQHHARLRLRQGYGGTGLALSRLRDQSHFGTAKARSTQGRQDSTSPRPSPLEAERERFAFGHGCDWPSHVGPNIVHESESVRHGRVVQWMAES